MYDDEEEEESLPPELTDLQSALQDSVERLNLTESGAWAMSSHLDQISYGIENLRSGIKTVICILHDLGRNKDPELRREAIHFFVKFEIKTLEYSLNNLVADVEDPCSPFHGSERLEYTRMLNRAFSLREEGLSMQDAYAAAINGIITDPEYRTILLNSLWEDEYGMGLDEEDTQDEGPLEL
jgi:hypothetical protein